MDDPEVPFEIFEAAGLLPIGLRGTGATSTEYADKYFKQLTCDFTRAMFNELARGQYDFLDGAVVYNCCDHMRRIDDNWKILPNPKNFHFLYIPKRWEASTYPRFCEEIKALINEEKGTIDRFEPYRITDANRLIEECMLVANVAAASNPSHGARSMASGIGPAVRRRVISASTGAPSANSTSSRRRRARASSKVSRGTLAASPSGKATTQTQRSPSRALCTVVRPETVAERPSLPHRMRSNARQVSGGSASGQAIASQAMAAMRSVEA